MGTPHTTKFAFHQLPNEAIYIWWNKSQQCFLQRLTSNASHATCTCTRVTVYAAWFGDSSSKAVRFFPRRSYVFFLHTTQGACLRSTMRCSVSGMVFATGSFTLVECPKRPVNKASLNLRCSAKFWSLAPSERRESKYALTAMMLIRLQNIPFPALSWVCRIG